MDITYVEKINLLCLLLCFLFLQKYSWVWGLPGEEVDSLQLLRQVLLLYGVAEGWVVFVAFRVSQLFHKPGWGIAEVQGDGRQGTFVASQTGLHIIIGLVDRNRLECSCQIDHTLSEDHLLISRWNKRKKTEVKTTLGLTRQETSSHWLVHWAYLTFRHPNEMTGLEGRNSLSKSGGICHTWKTRRMQRCRIRSTF